MNKVVEQCERTWRRLGVEGHEIEGMSQELAADLDSAQADGIAPETFVGGDPVGFARAWASARGAIRPRWRIASTVLAATVGTLPGAAVAFMLALAATSPWFIEMVDPTNPTLTCPRNSGCGSPYLNLPTWALSVWYFLALIVAVAGALLTVSAWLRRCADSARPLTLRVLLVAGPVGALIAGLVARLFDEAWGPATVDGHFRLAHAWPTVFVLMMWVIVGGCRWWSVWWSRSTQPRNTMTTESGPTLVDA